MTYAITSLGDTALLLPLGLLVLGLLLWQGERRGAIAWAVTLLVCSAVTLALKLGLRLCGPRPGSLELQSPSGHTSASAAVYGSLAILLAAGRPLWQQRVLAAGALLGILAIGLSRVRIVAHSWEEVVVGWAVGGASVALFWALHRRAGRPPLGVLPLLLGFFLLLVLLGGAHVSFEGVIGRVAHRLDAWFTVCR